MEDEILIDSVFHRPAIWDKRTANHHNRYELEKLRIEVANGLGEDVVKKRWKALREKFRKEKEKEESPSGSAAKWKSHWPHMNALRFLDSQFTPRKMDTNLNIIENNTLPDIYDESLVYDDNDLHPPPPSAVIGTTSSGATSSSASSQGENTPPNNTLPTGATTHSQAPSMVNQQATSSKSSNNIFSQRLTMTHSRAPSTTSPSNIKQSYGKRVVTDDIGAQLLALETEKFVARQEKSHNGPCLEDEDNKLFFMSLLPLIRNLSPRQKLEYRSKILNFTNNFLPEEEIVYQ